MIEHQASKPQPGQVRAERLSYKFQRLRERIRQAVAGGELQGKLPGERELAKRFDVNPKTLSKALTDLAAEGLLDRTVGRGTFVRGQAPAESAPGRWLLVCDQGGGEAPLARELLGHHVDAQVTTDPMSLRPSLLSQLDAVIDLGSATPEAFARGMVVRGATVVRVGREPLGCKTGAVLLDRVNAAFQLARDLALAGHRQITLAGDGDGQVLAAARSAIERYAPAARLEGLPALDIDRLVDSPSSGVLLDGEAAMSGWRRVSAARPDLARCSVAAMGMIAEEPSWTGIYVTVEEMAEAVRAMIRDAGQHRPATVYLTGRYVDRGTVHTVPESRSPVALSA